MGPLFLAGKAALASGFRPYVHHRHGGFEERRTDRRMLRPVDRPVEADQALELALDVDDIFSVHHPERAREVFLRDRKLGRHRDRSGLALLAGGSLFKDLEMGLPMAWQSGGTLLRRGRPESVDAHEMAPLVGINCGERYRVPAPCVSDSTED